MEAIDDDFVRRMDDKLSADDVGLHARPLAVAMEWVKEKGIYGDIFDKRIMDPLMAAYKRLYPNGNFSMPPVLIGGVALRGQMYPVRVNLAYGTVAIEPLKCIEISQQELALIFTHYPEQGWRALYGVCDLWDFGYGVSDLIEADSPASALLINARSSLVATARVLFSATDHDAAVQSACLTAELSLKAALQHLGFDDAQLKSLSHHLNKAADELIKLKPTANDDRLRKACSKFPNYVATRYSSHGLKKIELMDLGMRAQFVASEAVRRVGDRDMAGEAERDPNSLSRPDV